MFLLFSWALYKVLSQICRFVINESRWFFLTKAFVFLLKSCSFSSLLSLCHCWSFLLHMKQNDKFFALKMNTFLCLSSVLMTLGLQKDVEACDCVQCGGRRPVKWDMAPSIWAADLCTLTGRINERSPPPRSWGLLNPMSIIYSTGRAFSC